jgi:glutamate/tyrosine decarboxylase-like PLP-dependent enzyme
MIESTLSLAASKAIEFLTKLDTSAAGATIDAASLRERLGVPLPFQGSPADAVIERLAQSVEGGILGMASGRFYGWVIGGALPSALGADWLTATWDQNAAIYAAGPAAAIAEEVAGGWLKDLLALPDRASFAFVTGCQMANFTCLAAARHALLRERGWDVEARGLNGAPPIRIISSNRRHASIDRAVRFLGLGSDSLVLLEPSESETMDPAILERSLISHPHESTIVLLQAGDINTGVFDAFTTLIPLAKRYKAWVHVDGAFGLWAAASERYKHLTRDVELADSWATDGHKWLNVPYDCGYAFVADTDAHRSAMKIRAAYITSESGARDQIDWNPEWSRRARGFSTYCALLELGRVGVADLIERTCRYATEIVDGVGALAGVDVLWRPVLNQGLVSFGDEDRTNAVIARVISSGEAFFTPTLWRNKPAMRVSVVNWRTSAEDVKRAIAAVGRAL